MEPEFVPELLCESLQHYKTEANIMQQQSVEDFTVYIYKGAQSKAYGAI